MLRIAGITLRCVRGTRTRSRGALRPSSARTTSLEERRAQGMPGAPLAPIASRANRKDTQAEVTTGQAASPTFPARVVLRFPSCSPRRPGFFASVVGTMQSIVANLTPALVCRDHTTLPFAADVIRLLTRRAHRIPLPYVRDDREAPLVRQRNGGEVPLIWGQNHCGMLARRANRAWRACIFCPSGHHINRRISVIAIEIRLLKS